MIKVLYGNEFRIVKGRPSIFPICDKCDMSEYNCGSAGIYCLKLDERYGGRHYFKRLNKK